jgi:hypothetical protein
MNLHDVSCEASVNFHHISQNATPATVSPLDAARTMRFAKARNTMRLKCLPRKMKMDTSKVLRLPRRLELIF